MIGTKFGRHEWYPEHGGAKLDIVMITTGSRPRLLEQSLRSLREGAADWSRHRLTLVMDGRSAWHDTSHIKPEVAPDRVIINPERQGASRSRNIGASSTPKYLRQEAVCFVDDDIYACKGWDTKVAEILAAKPQALVSGHAHPFNHTITGEGQGWQATTVLSTVHIAMRWAIWDAVGWWTEPGGAGGSEDVDYCRRAVSEFVTPLLLTSPQTVLHTGIGSTTGKKLIGWEQVMANNKSLEALHGLRGVVYE